MLSPQDYAGRSGVSMFQSPKDTRLGISVSMQSSEVYSSGISLLELEKKVFFDKMTNPTLSLSQCISISLVLFHHGI